MEIYFVRHGESVGNVDGYSTEESGNLSQLGLRQAERLAQRLADMQFDAIYSSPLVRAMDTIRPYLKLSGRKAEIWGLLCEGGWQEERDASAPVRVGPPPPFEMPAGREDYFDSSGEMAWTPYPGEVYKESIQRIRETRRELLRRHDGAEDVVLLSGHFHSGSRLLEVMLGAEPDGRIYHDNAGLSCLRQEDDGAFSLIFSNRIR